MLEVPQEAIDFAEKIWNEGTPEEKLAFFAFEEDEPPTMIAFKFQYWIYQLYPRYYQSAPADFHSQMVLNMISAYYGHSNYINLGFRGCAKTTYTKLFIAYALLNDMQHRRKYIKVLSRNLGNSKQLVTDIYNLIVEVKPLYGNLFPKQKETKGEETMVVFTTVDGVKLMAGTVGQTQRGHIQDAYRPDFLIFDDVEDRESISSLAQTETTIWRIDEAIQGLAADGAYMALGNYISEEGVIQWFLNKPNMIVDKITIVDDSGEPTWPARYDKEKIEKMKGDSDDWYGEYMCLKPETLVLTPDGYKKICELKKGDFVISHIGNTKEILNVFESEGEDLLDITVNDKTVTITKNHPVLTTTGWVPAGELTEDSLVMSILHAKHLVMEKTYGYWTILDTKQIQREGRVYLLCRCKCGKEKEVIVKNLKSGQSTSCGCVGRKKTAERNTKHNLRFTKEWRAWQSIKNRCYNPKVVGYKNYGGRGIVVSPLWKDDFMAFYSYVGKAPEGTSIDRIDNNGNYEPGNVRWATKTEQSENRRTNNKINGVCISKVSRSLGGNHSLVKKRLDRGWKLERAVTEKSHATK